MTENHARGATFPEAPRGWLGRIGAASSAVMGGVAGAAPHILHHAGPIAGAALLTGAGGTFVFGAIGFLLMVPMLLQLRRRFRSWAAPVVALMLFAVMFTVSALWIGPAIRGTPGEAPGGQPIDHASHHRG